MGEEHSTPGNQLVLRPRVENEAGLLKEQKGKPLPSLEGELGLARGQGITVGVGYAKEYLRRLGGQRVYHCRERRETSEGEAGSDPVAQNVMLEYGFCSQEH